MGNSGRSSTGCALCRKRKIKCDEGRPGCRKCAQIRKPCPGYPFSIALEVLPASAAEPNFIPFPVSGLGVGTADEPAFDWNQLSEAQPSVRIPDTPPPAYTPRIERLGPHQAHCAPVGRATGGREGAHFSASKNYTRSITPPPKYDVQHQATCFFLNLFSFKATRLYSIPVLDFLPDMLARSTEGSPISQASRAVSRMLLADRYSGYDSRLQTSDEYAKALEAIRSTMSDVGEAVKDESVTAVWLLGLYEAINSVLSHGLDSRQPKDLDAEWHSHIQHMRGAMRLLRLRGMQQFTNARSEQIFRVFKAAIRMRLFMLNHVTSADFDYLEVDIYKDEHEFVPSETANKATNFFTNTAQHLERAKYTLQRFETQPDSRDIATEIDQLLYEGECYDASMLRWSKTDPGWDIMPVTGDLSYTMWALYPFHALYYFHNFWIFLYWIRFFIARIKLYETLIELVKAKKRNSIAQQIPLQRLTNLDSKTENFIRIIQKTADELIGLTAYALGDVSSSGTIISVPSSGDPNGGWKEVNVVAAMQLVIPLKVLQRCIYTSPVQKGAINDAIIHIADGFRRQPIVPEYMR